MWTITKDHLWEEGDSLPSREGSSGNVDIDGEILPVGLDMAFRLYDDDGELYYEGLLQDDDECLNQIEALRFGNHDAGCTRIEVLRGGQWVQEIG